jgi:phage-related protein
MIITLAEGLTDALPELVPAIATAIATITETIVQHLPELIEVAIKLIIALVKGLGAALPILIQAMPKITKALIDGLMVLLPQLPKLAIELISALADGLIRSIPSVVSAVRDICQELMSAFSWANLFDIGKKMIQGFWEGIKERWNELLDDLKGLINQLPESIKKILGIASPSKVGLSLGRNFGSSLGLGLLPALEEVKNGLASSMRGFASSASSGARAGVSQLVQSETFGLTNYGNIIFPGAQTPGTLAASIKAKRY